MNTVRFDPKCTVCDSIHCQPLILSEKFAFEFEHPKVCCRRFIIHLQLSIKFLMVCVLCYLPRIIDIGQKDTHAWMLKGFPSQCLSNKVTKLSIQLFTNGDIWKGKIECYRRKPILEDQSKPESLQNNMVIFSPLSFSWHWMWGWKLIEVFSMLLLPRKIHFDA